MSKIQDSLRIWGNLEIRSRIWVTVLSRIAPRRSPRKMGTENHVVWPRQHTDWVPLVRCFKAQDLLGTCFPTFLENGINRRSTVRPHPRILSPQVNISWVRTSNQSRCKEDLSVRNNRGTCSVPYMNAVHERRMSRGKLQKLIFSKLLKLLKSVENSKFNSQQRETKEIWWFLVFFSNCGLINHYSRARPQKIDT